MIFQFKNLETNELRAFSNPALLRFEVEKLTNRDEGASVYEWATTPCFGSTRYDNDKFEIMIISGDD